MCVNSCLLDAGLIYRLQGDHAERTGLSAGSGSGATGSQRWDSLQGSDHRGAGTWSFTGCSGSRRLSSLHPSAAGLGQVTETVLCVSICTAGQGLNPNEGRARRKGRVFLQKPRIKEPCSGPEDTSVWWRPVRAGLISYRRGWGCGGGCVCGGGGNCCRKAGCSCPRRKLLQQNPTCGAAASALMPQKSILNLLQGL